MRHTKKITLSALFSALGVVILLLASVLQVADLAVSMLASFLIMLALIELGQSYAVMIYLGTSFLSLAFLPNKFIAAIYLAFTGLYPLLKRLFDGRGTLSVLLKALYFNGALTAALLLAKFVFTLGEEYRGWYLAIYYLIANLAFWLFDTVLKRMTYTYLVSWREKTKRFFK